MVKKSLLQILCGFLFTSFLYGAERVTVSRVIDGDTIETSQGVKIRLIGINAPEIQDLFGEQSKQHLRSLVEGKVVDLVSDNISSDSDRYNRLLRYVIVNGTDVNKRMVEDGFAFAYLKFRFDKATEYLEAEKKAKALAVGIWSRDDANTIAQQQDRDSNRAHHSIRIYVVGGLVLLLIVFGLYFYMRR
jgi:micrococcal nuclease